MAYFKDGLTSYVRKSLGLTQVDLALILKVNPVTVSKWERGSTPEEPKDREKTYLEYFKRAIEQSAEKSLQIPAKEWLRQRGPEITLFRILKEVLEEECEGMAEMPERAGVPKLNFISEEEMFGEELEAINQKPKRRKFGKKNLPSSISINFEGSEVKIEREESGAVKVFQAGEKVKAMPILRKIAKSRNIEIRDTDGPWTLGRRILRELARE